MMADTAVDLVVNCYERTYRKVLAPGFFAGIDRQHRGALPNRYALINNVHDDLDAGRAADVLVDRGELTGWAFVRDQLPLALQATKVRKLGRRPYFLDFGLAMSVTGDSPYVLGWDAEIRLWRTDNWIRPAVDLLRRRSDVFSVAPGWPANHPGHDSLPDETIERYGRWCLNYGFSDQVFLVRRSELGSPIYGRVAPSAVVRNAPHPRTFEARLESYQRSERRYRATASDLRYEHTSDVAGEVMDRLGDRTRLELLEAKVLTRLRPIVARIPVDSPRWRLP
jgi:hypothetical protein